MHCPRSPSRLRAVQPTSRGRATSVQCGAAPPPAPFPRTAAAAAATAGAAAAPTRTAAPGHC
eukprot:4818061-Karenia_brevis.AAC.1